MEKISKQQYLDALNIVEAYQNQLVKNIEGLESKQKQLQIETNTYDGLMLKDIGLPAFVLNRLLGADLKCVEDIIICRRNDLLKFRLMGPTALDIIEDALKKYGYSLKN